MSWLSSFGDSSQTTNANTSSATNPWGAAIPNLTSILNGLGGINYNPTGTETNAINTLEGNAANGNPYAGQIRDLTNTLFTGGTDRTGIATDAYDGLLSKLAPTANGDYLDPNKNPFFAQTTQTIGNDVMERLKGMYAGSGRDPSGAGNFGYNVARGVGEATAPVFAQTYNTERNNQLGAINSMYGAGNQTTGILSGLDQDALANKEAGVNASGAALDAQNYGPMQTLALEAQRRGIPLGILQQLAGSTSQIAGLGNTSNGTVNSTVNKSASGLDQLLGLGKAAALFV
jgi:hypothetical protein